MKKREVLPPPWFKKLLGAILVVIAVVVASTVFFLVSFFAGGEGDVKIEIEGPAEVYRGVPFEVDVSISNETENLVNQVELTSIPNEQIVSLNGLDGRGGSRDEVGDMGGKSFSRRTYQFIVQSEATSSSEIEVGFQLSYFSSNRARFESSKTKKIAVKGEAVEFEIKKPDQIVPGSQFELEINYKNVSDFDFPETVLEAKYPPAFQFVSADLTPDSLNNYWRLGEVRSGSSGRLIIRGTLLGGGEGAVLLPIVFSASFSGEDYIVAEAEAELKTAPSPLAIQILINGQPNYVARIGDKLAYAVRYENRSGIALADLVVKAELKGELYDFATVSTNGRFDAPSRTVTWDASVLPALRMVDAGALGEFQLTVQLKADFPIFRLNDKNFSVNFGTEISSPSVPYYLAASRTRALAALETKISGLVTVDAQGFYRDARAGIVNDGFMPPKVGAATEYTIHWVIRNYATDASGVSLRAPLPPGVRWTGAVKSNIDSVPLFDEETNEVIWAIEKIRATKGILDAPIEGIFQIEGTPSSADIGRFELLLGETSLRATDDFTGLGLSSSDVAINSSLPDDITIGQNGGRVVP